MSDTSASAPAGRPRGLRIYVALVAAAAAPVALLAFARVAGAPPDGDAALGALVFLTAALVSELNPVRLDGGGERSVSLALTFILGTALLFGWPWAVLTAMLSTSLAQLRERTPAIRLVLNTASYGLGAVAAAVPLTFVGYGPAAGQPPRFELLTLLAFTAGAAFLLVNVGTVAVAVSLATGLRMRVLLEGWVRDSGFAFTIMAFIAALAASLWIVHPPLEVLLGGPLLALALYQRYAYRSAVARRDAETDALTALGNHRAFQADLQGAVERCLAGGAPLALCLLDIDDFKSINDRFGHPVGDGVLAQLAGLVREAVPQARPYRIGGEEFALLFEDHDDERACAALDALHGRLRAIPFDHGEGVTVSIGVACVPGHADDRDEALRVADAALYWAKNHGKDRSCVYDAELVGLQTPQELARTAEQQARLRAAEGLIRVVDAKDTYSGAHSQSVARLVEAIARELGLDREETERVRLAGLLHDLGKIAIPDAILQKPGRLDADEQRLMRGHAELGFRLVEGLGIAPVDVWIRHHHEWWDGSGYPAGLAGEQIPLGARIIAVADAFDAMTSDRSYRVADTSAGAVAELRRRSWVQFDARVVAALERHLDAAPAAETRAA